MNLNQLIPTALIAATVLASFAAFNNPALMERYQFQVGRIRYSKQYDRLLSSGFVHNDWAHLFFNMLTLYFFSPVIIMVYGVFVFLALYLGAIVAGNAFSLWLYKTRPGYTAVGASGGVSGILFASISLDPLNGILFFFIPMTAWIFATLYFAYSVTMLLRPRPWDNIGHAAHLGGAVVGMLCVAVLSPYFFTRNIVYISIMSLPLLYLAYELLFNKKVR